MDKKLIINADDFGVSEDINVGIVECFRRGVVTDISLLACGHHFDHAVWLAKENNINKIGMHFALTGAFESVSGHAKIPSIADKKNILPKSFPQLLIKYFIGKLNMEEIYIELKAQIAKIKNAHFEITHLDSHEHIHIFGPILKFVLKVMREENIHNIRFPMEKVSMFGLIVEPFNAIRHFALRCFCNLSKRLLREADIKHNKYFFGHFHAHRLNRRDFYSFIRRIKPGITEIGCHPGYFGLLISKSRPWYRHCEQELDVLCDKKFRKEIEKRKIQLTSYS